MTGKSARKAYRKSGKLSDAPSYQNLFVACLPREVTNAMLQQLFAPFSPLSATVMLNMTTGKSKGFGFVVFDSDEQGEAAMSHFADRQVTVEGVSAPFVLHISPSKFNGKSIVQESPFVFFRNIPSCLSKSEIRHSLQRFGRVVHIQQRDDEHSNDGSLVLLMIEFGSTEEAKSAIDNCHQQHMFPQLAAVPVMAKFADAPTVKAQMRRHSRSGTLSPTSPSLGVNSGASTPQQASLNLDSYQMPRCLSGNSESDEAGLSDFELNASEHNQSRRVSLASNEGGRRVSLSVIGNAVDWTSARRFSSASTSSRPESACWFRNDPYRDDGYVIVETPAGFEFGEVSPSQSQRLA